MYPNPFIRPVEGYVRDLNIIENYNAVAAQYLSIQTGDSLETAKAWVEANTQPIDPTLNVLARRTGADRVKEKQTLSQLLNEAEHGGKLLGPNLILYSNPKQKLSFLSEFIEVGMANRSKIKKRYQKAEMEGDMATATFCNNQQVTVKTLNNTLSGAHASRHNPIYNPSAHSTLTSVCRCATTYSNAVVERLLAGNRHYYSPEVTVADMTSLIRNADRALVKQAMETHDLAYPSADTLLLQILTSVHQYWRSDTYEGEINDFIIRMSDEERAIVAYTLDLKAIRDNNPSVIRSLLQDLVSVPTVGIDDPEVYHRAANDDMISMVGLICADLLKGRSVNKMIEESKTDYGIYGAVIKQTMDTFHRYRYLIQAFIATDNMPSNIHSVPSALRRVAIVSDTDSTIFTTSNWVDWYLGKAQTPNTVMAIAAVTAYLHTQALAHTLAQLSRQLGVEDSKLMRLSMKSEFYMECIGVTNQTKHYFSYIRACEGEVYPKAKLDLKGVNLKSSRLPKRITSELKTYVRWIMDNALSPTRPTMAEVLEAPAKLAHHLVHSLQRGEVEFLMRTQVKSAAAYKNPSAPATQQHTLWETVFAPVHGHAEARPYGAVKIPVSLAKRSELEEWASTLTPSMQGHLREWLLRDVTYVVATVKSGYDGVSGSHPVNKETRILLTQRDTPVCGPMGRIYQYNGPTDNLVLSEIDYSTDPQWTDCGAIREGFTQFFIPTTQLKEGLIPEECRRAMDIERIEDELMNSFFMVLETTGLYFKNKSRSRLLTKEIDISIYDKA